MTERAVCAWDCMLIDVLNIMMSGWCLQTITKCTLMHVKKSPVSLSLAFTFLCVLESHKRESWISLKFVLKFNVPIRQFLRVMWIRHLTAFWPQKTEISWLWISYWDQLKSFKKLASLLWWFQFTQKPCERCASLWETLSLKFTHSSEEQIDVCDRY